MEAGVFGPRMKYSELIIKVARIFAVEIYPIEKCTEFSSKRRYKRPSVSNVRFNIVVYRWVKSVSWNRSKIFWSQYENNASE